MLQYEHITAFQAPHFQTLFQTYFAEMNIQVRDWAGLFREMDQDGRHNEAFLALDSGIPLGFIQFCPMELSGWFFTCHAGFIREFWVVPGHRNKGLGSALLAHAEDRLRQLGAELAILTTDTAEEFYLAHGYTHAPIWKARNGDDAFTKVLAAPSTAAGTAET